MSATHSNHVPPEQYKVEDVGPSFSSLCNFFHPLISSPIIFIKEGESSTVHFQKPSVFHLIE
jgi:hypothetical protein